MVTDFEVKRAAFHCDIRSTLDNIFGEITTEYDQAASEHKTIDAYLARMSEHCGRLKKHADHGAVLRLNVGGRNFDISETSIALIGQHHSILSTFFSSKWTHCLVRNRGDRLFLNVNPEWMESIVSPLRLRQVVDSFNQPVPKMSPEHNCGFNATVLYYKMGAVFPDRKIVLSSLSNISCMNAIDSTESLFSFVAPELLAVGNLPNMKLHLLYRGSRDGYDPAHFMSKCGGKADTICVVEDTLGNVFGGYASDAWVNNSTSILTSVLFSLSDTNGPRKLDLRQAYQHFPGHNNGNNGNKPTTFSFGGVFLHVHQKVGSSCQSNLDTSNRPLSATSMTKTHLSGPSPNFAVNEIEVYAIDRTPVRMNTSELALSGFLSPLKPLILAGIEGGKFNTSLLYNSNSHGLDCKSFHAAINGKQRTLIIIRDASGSTFGSFQELVSPGVISKITAGQSFVFSLDPRTISLQVTKIGAYDNSVRTYCNYGSILKVDSDNRISQQLIPANPNRQQSAMVEIMAYEVHYITESMPHPNLDKKISGARAALDAKFRASSEELQLEVDRKFSDLKTKQVKLLTELLWVEHLSASPASRDIDTGLLREWLAISGRIDTLAALDSRKEIMAEIAEAMDRLGVPREGTSGHAVTDVKAHTELVHDEVVSYNVGGTIIAVLKSTLLRQAPDSTFAARFSGRWDKSGAESEPDDIEDGHICLVRLHPALFPRPSLSSSSVSDTVSCDRPLHPILYVLIHVH